MHRPTTLASLAILFGFVFFGVPAAGAGKKKSADKPDLAAAAVENVLRAEVAGPTDRRAQLSETLKLQPDSRAARWQAHRRNSRPSPCSRG